MTDQRTEHEPWPMRAASLFLLGALSGLAFDLLLRGSGGDYWSVTESIPRLSLATFVATGGVLFAFTLERARRTWSLAFAAGAGAVLAAIFYWNGSPQPRGDDDVWRAFAALLAVAIAAPLFQTMRDEGARRLPYGPVHAHAWANIVIWCAAWAFVFITWLLANLLASLFQLIGIELLHDLLGRSWFVWMLVGGTLGGAIALLRDRDRIVGLLQRVATTILSMLAPVLAAGLVLFVLALPFTGLGSLWEQTRATTPILLACIFGAFVLANAVIGAAPEEEAKSRALRWSAMALGATMLPLAIVAAISTWLRVAQYGLTPERLWALVFVAIALACALLYLYALVRGRDAWGGRLRPANIRLAIGICVVALVLATPLADFGALSTRFQLARLQSGRVPAVEFDWAAMRFDFGPSGVAALERIKAAGPPEQRRLAASALHAAGRWDFDSPVEVRRQRQMPHNVRIAGGAAIPPALREVVWSGANCVRDEPCVLLHQPGSARALLVSPGYCGRPEGSPPRMRPGVCDPALTNYYLVDGEWRREPPWQADVAAAQARHARLAEAIRQGRAEIRTVERRQVFLDGEPIGEPFD